MLILAATLIALCALQRLAELSLSRRNQAAMRGRFYARAEPLWLLRSMIALHVAWFAGMAAEPILLGYRPVAALQYLSLAAFLAAQGLRYWAIRSLGGKWNISVMSRSGNQETVTVGPYAYIRHPNYLAVIIEILCLPLAASAYWTAAICSLVNALILGCRIRYEEEALLADPIYRQAMSAKPRFFPTFAVRKG